MKKPYSKMSAEELAETTREFDKPGAAQKFKPLTPAQRKWWKKAASGSTRRRKAEGSDVHVLVSIDPELLVRAYRLARERGHSLSKLVSEGLAAALKKRSA